MLPPTAPATRVTAGAFDTSISERPVAQYRHHVFRFRIQHGRWRAREGAGGTGGAGVVAAGDVGKSDVAGKLGIQPDMVVQELGWDSDVDDSIREAVEERCGDDLLDEDADDVIDVVLMWWR